VKDNRPEIRFKGFSEDWEKRKLEDLVTSVVREVPKPDKPYKRISVRSHAKGTFHQIVSDPKTVSMDKLYVVKENDLIVNITFAWEHAIAVANKVDDGLLVSHRFPTFVIDKSDINFIHYSVIQDVFRRKMELISPGGAGRNRVLNKKDFINLKIDTPPQIEEQIEIGNFLKQLDEIISLHQQELTTLKQTKQGFLQKMFPKEGEVVPEVRFPGFDGEWEQCKFKDFISKAGKKNATGENYLAYSVSNKLGLVSQKEQFDGSRLDNLDKTSYKLVHPDEFAYNPARINVGSIAFNNLNETVIVSSLYVVIKMSDKLDNEFILQFMKSPTFNNEVRRNTEGSVREYLFFESFKNIKFPYTSNKDEQAKIGEFFKELDDTIALQQGELDALKETKKAFLQKMFV
jgi:type I restriction enzyme, S subunit